ncbi:hypothetical protein [Qipengyuania gelatinilytica]|uniref:DUF1772 domain-containing protein n=1 Tax=Qipengyuania gelatinilytica TaxID=2867231 RepID=A0ABX9A1T6_9SPHN|nr:hypothetical protein [Qipengyuania gelatinilytica]QZD95230.1 hypothetical protein K3136_00415 [Qipengyuania gelatinilytica]
MSLRRAFIWTWVGGLVLFAIVIALGMPLVLTQVPGGILDHQAAATGAEVDRIQSAWRSAGLWNQAALAMMGDLLFIGIYGIGCVLGGLYFRRSAQRWIAFAGTVALASGAVFLVTDYAETISQIVQLWRFEGDDGLAGLAATVRPWKIASWILATLAIIACLMGEWKARRSA